MSKFTKRGLLLTLLVTLGLLSATAQSVVHNKAWYEQSQFNYTWTDAHGASHTSKLTDVATNPRQIIALLKKTYTDPNIPGIKYSGYNSNGGRTRQVTYGSVAGGWGITSVTAPYQEGYTIFMVSLKNYETTMSNSISTYQELVNYIDYNIESVQLLTNGMRIGTGRNAGTVFNISGNYNRFFFLGKGRATPNWGSAPFLNMFEEFSPTSPSGGETADFYSKMVAGETYNVIHDCPTVINLTHYFSMTGKDGTEKRSMTGLNFFVPDYRFYNVSSTTQVYNTAYSPKTGLYTIKLNAAASMGNDENSCNVTLNWTSSLNTIAKGTVPQSYTIYMVITDENGNESYEKLNVTPNPTGATSIVYSVPRHESSYTINYIISGTPSNEDYSNFFTWSNTASVVIPGYSTDEILSFVLDHYECDYNKDNERNYYRNVFNIKNENIAYGITPSIIKAGHSSYDLYRKDNNGITVTVAHLTLTVSGTTVRYNVTYEGQDIVPGYSLSSLGIATSGSLGSYSNNTIINMSNIVICDQFSAETVDNEHPSRYEYVLRETTDESPIYSNTAVVPVFKTNASIGGNYTLHQVMNDVDATLNSNALNTNVEMQLSSNPGIYYYTLSRGIDDSPQTMISKLQHRTDGSYLEMLDELPQYAGQVIEMGAEATKWIDRFDNNYIDGELHQYVSYQPVLWLFGNDRMKHDGESSYGSTIWRTGVGSVQISMNNYPSNYGLWYDEMGNECTVYDPIITLNGLVPEVDGAEYEPYMYRVWRICDDVRAYTVDPLTGDYVNDPAGDRSRMQLIAEEVTDNAYVTFGGGNELDFGATADASIDFCVRFYYVKKGQSASNKPMFCIAETFYNWNNDVTGITETRSHDEVSKTYYNIMGVPSQSPYSGINIIVTHYSDGSIHTSKVIL